MADQKMPDEMIAWMQDRQWGPHHREWHYVRRWEFRQALTMGHPDPQQRSEIAEMVRDAVERGWKRAALQEGTTGSGLDFLANALGHARSAAGRVPRRKCRVAGVEYTAPGSPGHGEPRAGWQPVHLPGSRNRTDRGRRPALCRRRQSWPLRRNESASHRRLIPLHAAPTRAWACTAIRTTAGPTLPARSTLVIPR